MRTVHLSALNATAVVVKEERDTVWHNVFEYCVSNAARQAQAHAIHQVRFFSRALPMESTNNTHLKFTSHIDGLPFIRCYRSGKMNKTRNIYFFAFKILGFFFFFVGFVLAMQLLSMRQFKCWTNGVYLSRDRKILYYDDEYQIPRKFLDYVYWPQSAAFHP